MACSNDFKILQIVRVVVNNLSNYLYIINKNVIFTKIVLKSTNYYNYNSNACIIFNCRRITIFKII